MAVLPEKCSPPLEPLARTDVRFDVYDAAKRLIRRASFQTGLIELIEHSRHGLAADAAEAYRYRVADLRVLLLRLAAELPIVGELLNASTFPQ